MNSGGDDDRWTSINPTAGHDTYTSFKGGITLSGATVTVKFYIDNNTGYPIIQTVFGPCLAEGGLFTIAFRGEDQRGEDYSFLCWEGECGMASAVCFHVCPNRMLDYWTPSGRQGHQRVG